MKIESVQFFDAFDCIVSEPVPQALYDQDDTMPHLAAMIWGVMKDMKAVQAIAWLNLDSRYILVREEDFTVVYRGKFNKPIN